ncbi:BLUF domain-containing protein [Vibrio genomosp. F10]|uniref:BLUF domain-containing protein n=1 Tax=Vibrio genomosp. F10 TaxID=723171 RepID=UPI00035DFB38|nr:BLUF domain-containing protein [Vibrio genomosp. F10]OEF07304.1 blue light sensor protein [Vibrio genomosp. F10 str. 9ZB36]
MILCRLIYVSTIPDHCDSADMDNILNTSRRNNQSSHLSGLLSFNKKYFLQCLEGSREEVNKTYRRIQKDNRHSNVTIIYYKEVNCREFGDWSMGHVPPSYLSALLTLQFSSTDEFNPYQMSGESAYLLLLELKQDLPSV